MSTVTAPPAARVGGLLREWRQRKRLSQLDLAVSAGVSTRHLSFVETGRSRPSRELVLHLAQHLGVPLRDRNTLLLAAGYAPVYRQTPLDAEEMGPVRRALDKIVRGHEPFPAIVVDRRWDLVTANAAAQTVLGEGVDPALLEAPVNALRVSLHPEGLASSIENLPEWRTHLLERLGRQIDASGSPELLALAEELDVYPGGAVEHRAGDVVGRLFVPLVLRSGDVVLRLFSTVATFGTALDITVAELSIETFFPADASTAEELARRHALH